MPSIVVRSSLVARPRPPSSALVCLRLPNIPRPLPVIPDLRPLRLSEMEKGPGLVRRNPLSLVVAILAVVLATRSSVAQAGARAARIEGTSFVLGRYASTGTFSVYGAFARGPVMGMVGGVRNPRADYRVWLVGGGTHLRFGVHQGITMLAAFAAGTGGSAVRLYVLPSLRARRWGVSGITKAYLPLRAGGRWQAAADPLTVSVRVTSFLGAGVAGVLRAQTGSAVTVGVGPSAVVQIPGASVKAEVIGLSRSGGVETRLTLGMTF